MKKDIDEKKFENVKEKLKRLLSNVANNNQPSTQFYSGLGIEPIPNFNQRFIITPPDATKAVLFPNGQKLNSNFNLPSVNPQNNNERDNIGQYNRENPLSIPKSDSSIVKDSLKNGITQNSDKSGRNVLSALRDTGNEAEQFNKNGSGIDPTNVLPGADTTRSNYLYDISIGNIPNWLNFNALHAGVKANPLAGPRNTTNTGASHRDTEAFSTGQIKSNPRQGKNEGSKQTSNIQSKKEASNNLKQKNPDQKSAGLDKGIHLPTIKIEGKTRKLNHEIQTDNDSKIQVYFKNSDDGHTSDNDISETTASAVENSIKLAAMKGHNIKSILVRATTNGIHADGSLHYSGKAVDICAINGIPVKEHDKIMSQIEAIQNAFETQSGRSQNFGPAMLKIYGKKHYSEKLAKGHSNHIHLGTD